MKLADGRVFDVPDSDVGMAQMMYKATPAEAAPDTLEGVGVNPAAPGLGAVNQVLGSIGGMRGVAGIGAAGAGLYGLKRLLGRRSAPPDASRGKSAKALSDVVNDVAAPSEARKEALKKMAELKQKPPRAPRGRAKNPGAVAEGSGDLTAQLEKSIALEQEMGRRGMSMAAKGGMRKAMRGVPGALNIALMLMDASSFPEQMDEAQQMMAPILAAERERKYPGMTEWMNRGPATTEMEALGRNPEPDPVEKMRKQIEFNQLIKRRGLQPAGGRN